MVGMAEGTCKGNVGCYIASSHWVRSYFGWYITWVYGYVMVGMRGLRVDCRGKVVWYGASSHWVRPRLLIWLKEPH